MDQERYKKYNPEKFWQIFDKFDADKNGYLEKKEIASLIKEIYARK